MSTATTPEIDQYLDGVRAALADLPVETRDELLEDLPAHLAEVAAEGAGSLVERLGTPAAYAAELRAAAGVEVIGRQVGSGTAAAAAAARLASTWDRIDLRVGPLLGYGRLSEFGQLLRPAWWVLRGYIVAMLVLGVLAGNPGLLPNAFGRNEGNLLGSVLGWAIALAFIAGSVRFAQRTRRMPTFARWALRAATAVLVFIAGINLLVIDDQIGESYSGPAVYDPVGAVSDVYPYDSTGRPLTDIQLFDQDGNPITVGQPYRCRALSDDARPPVTEVPWRYPLCPLGPGLVLRGGTPQPSAPQLSGPTGSPVPSVPSASSVPATSPAPPAPTVSAVPYGG